MKTCYLRVIYDSSGHFKNEIDVVQRNFQKTSETKNNIKNKWSIFNSFINKTKK